MFERALSSYGDEVESFREEVAVALNKKENDNLDKDNEIRYAKKGYSKRDISEVSEKEFNHHYWAIANNLLSKEEIGLLNSSVANIGKGEYYYQNVDGFYMIPVGENGVLNKIVFTDGKQYAYSIDTVIEIACYNETDLTDIRSVVYARERNGIQPKNSELFKVYYSKDFRYNDFVAEIQNYSQYSNGKQDGTRSDRKTSRAIKFSKETIDNKNSGNGVDVNEDLVQGLSEKERAILLKIDSSASYKRIKEQLDGLKPLEIRNKIEYEVLYGELKKRNGNNPLDFEWAQTEYGLYIVKNNTADNFTPVIRIDKKNNSNLIYRLLSMIDYNNYNANKTIDKWLNEIFNHPECLKFFNPDPLYYPGYNIEDSVAVTDVSRKAKNQPIYKETDSKGRKLTEEQIEFFKNSKVRDRYGRLQQVYHGTYGEFYVFDRALRGQSTKADDAKLGFFFTNSRKLAEDYSLCAKDNKIHNLIYKIIIGDSEAAEFLKNNELEDIDVQKAKEIGSDDLVELSSMAEDKSTSIFEVFLNIKNPYIENWENSSYNKAHIVRAITKAKLKNCDGVILRRIDDSIRRKRPLSDVFIAFEPNQIKLVTNKNPSRKYDIRFSKKITSDMTDGERYEILKNKKIENIPYAKELTKGQLDNIQRITSFEDLNRFFGAEKRSIIKKIASEFGVFKEYYNKDIELSFNFSNRGYEESYGKQKHNFVSYAKMFSVFDDVVNNAVGIEIHNRNIENYKKDQTLSNVYVLASAFFDKESIVPVKLEVKEFSDKKNTLYVAIALESIKKDGVSEQEVAKGVAQQYSRPSTISIRDLLKNVNPNDKDFYKYIPKQFFHEDSKNVKFSRKVSDGQISKKLADISKLKVYSKKEALEVINDVIGGIDFGNGLYVETTKKNAEEIATELWEVMNTIFMI